jgi:hypothetical protein
MGHACLVEVEALGCLSSMPAADPKGSISVCKVLLNNEISAAVLAKPFERR